jgi:hypothetical protein
MVELEDFSDAATNSEILPCHLHTGSMVEVRTSCQPQLGKQIWQPIEIFEGVDQQCLPPIAQELQINAQAFLRSSLAFFKRSRSICNYRISQGVELTLQLLSLWRCR